MRAELKRMLRELADERQRRKAPQETAPARRAAGHRARRHHSRATATANSSPSPTNGTKPHTDRRQKSASICRATPAPAKRPASATACCCASHETDEDDGIRHRGRVINIIDHPKHRVLGIFRALPQGGGRIEPVDKKMLGKELSIPASATENAQDGDLVAVEIVTLRPARPAAGPRQRTARLAQDRTRGQHDRDRRA